ncbi:hypothetical protein [Candidatus Lokiarchaeum ossiferum]|uniref:hypothetical protein n=1 Tax=Candidatus Lokiarchaeum ossiferum TaxID=2951803 RepID=UPI00352EA11A
MNSNDKKKLLKLIQNVYFYAIYANYPLLKNLFNYVIHIVIKLLSFNEIDKISCEMLENFVSIEKQKPPHALPSNLDKENNE